MPVFLPMFTGLAELGFLALVLVFALTLPLASGDWKQVMISGGKVWKVQSVERGKTHRNRRGSSRSSGCLGRKVGNPVCSPIYLIFLYGKKKTKKILSATWYCEIIFRGEFEGM